MKRIVFLPIMIISLCGCVSQKQITPIHNNIFFTSNIILGEQEYVCDVTLDKDALNLIVTAPENIKGLSLNVGNNGYNADFKGISYSLDTPYNSSSNVAQILFDVFNDVADKTFDFNNQNALITGFTNGNKYSFLFSPSGYPLALKIKSINLEINFSNVTLI